MTSSLPREDALSMTAAAAYAEVARTDVMAGLFPELCALTGEAPRRHATPTPDPDPRDARLPSGLILRPSESVCLVSGPTASRGSISGRAQACTPMPPSIPVERRLSATPWTLGSTRLHPFNSDPAQRS
jgi:hypothetical protein